MAYTSTSNEIILISDSTGKPMISFKNGTQQFYDNNGNVRIQIGQDATGDFKFVLYDETGEGVLIDSDGIKPSAISDGLIQTDMLANKAVTKDKVGFEYIEPNEYGGIDITKVYNGEGELFGVEYTAFKEGVETTTKELDKKIDASATYTLYVETPNGTRMTPSGLHLNAKLFKNSVNVTDEWDDSYFVWTRQSSDSYGDIYWNDAHSTGTKSLYITAIDVEKNATFQCKFETDGLSLTSIA